MAKKDYPRREKRRAKEAQISTKKTTRGDASLVDRINEKIIPRVCRQKKEDN